MAHQATAPKDHWSNYWTTDQAAECLSYGRIDTPEGLAIYQLLWNDIGPGLPLADNWGKLSEAQQEALDAGYAKEYPEG